MDYLYLLSKVHASESEMIIMENVDGILKDKQTGVAPIDVVKNYFVKADGTQNGWLFRKVRSSSY